MGAQIARAAFPVPLLQRARRDDADRFGIGIDLALIDSSDHSGKSPDPVRVHAVQIGLAEQSSA